MAISRTHVTLSRIKSQRARETFQLCARHCGDFERKKEIEPGLIERVDDALRPLKCTLLASFVMLINAAAARDEIVSRSSRFQYIVVLKMSQI